MKDCLITISFILTIGNAHSQTGRPLQYRFQHLNQTDGLAGNHIMHITQDDEGYIWIATLKDGLQRYDGIRFHSFKNKFLNPVTNTFEISDLLYENKQLIVFSENQFFNYNPFNQQFFPIEFSSADAVKHTFTDEAGNTWYIKRNLLSRFKPGNKIPDFEYRFLRKLIGTNMPLVYDSIGGQYWFFNENNLLLFDIATQKVKRVTNHTHPDLFKNILRDNDYEISNMMLTPDRNLWFSTWSGPIGRINLANGKTTGYSLKKSLRTSQNPTGPMGINLFYLDNYGQLWATTYGAGLLRYNVSNDNFDYILSDRSDPQSLWYNYELKSLFQDAQDNIWVGTDIGISIFNPYQENFQILKHNKNNPSSLPPNEIETILQASNKEVWVGTWGGGITVFDSSLNFKKHMTFESTAANMVWSFMEDDRNRVWVGCQRGMIMRYDLHSKKFEKPFYSENNRSTIRFMTKDKSGNLYLGMQNGNVIKWDAFTDAFIFPDDREIPGTRPPVSYLYIDSLDNLWVNIGTAIMKYDTKEMKLLKRFPLVSSIIEKSKIPTISSISPFNDSLLAVSNAQGSGGFLNTRSGKFEKWNLTPTAGSRRVSAIKKDKNNHIWFASGWDLFRFTPGSEHKPTNYIVEKHLLGSPFFTGKTAELSDGRWAFFTSTEVLIFKPENLGNNTERKETGSLAVTGFKIFGEKRPIDSLLLNNLPVYLNHTENYITIEFSPLVYTPLQENKYVYKLTGINSQWLTADENFSVTYTSLDPGNYTFMIKLDSEEEPEKITSFRIVVRPPFWKTWWFYFLCTLAASGLAWLIIGWKIKGIRKEANLKRKVLETEMAALRAQMNPHFIFNCINAIDSLIPNINIIQSNLNL